MANLEENTTPKKHLELELDRLEANIKQLRILYEQYFVQIQPHPPDKLQQETTRQMRNLLKAPFKNSASRFRLQTLIQRYQTYATYWERVLKQREGGTYKRDVFKAEMRAKQVEEAKVQRKPSANAEAGIKQLFNSYEAALRKNGSDTSNIDYESFKRSLLTKAKQMKEQSGVDKLNYKIVVSDGRVVIKASAK